jgi:hypothetical protein
MNSPAEIAGGSSSSSGPCRRCCCRSCYQASRPDIARGHDGSPAGRVIEELQAAIADINAVRKYAKTPERGQECPLNFTIGGRPCRCLETAVRFAEQMHDINEVDKFHRLILEEIGR